MAVNPPNIIPTPNNEVASLNTPNSNPTPEQIEKLSGEWNRLANLEETLDFLNSIESICADKAGIIPFHALLEINKISYLPLSRRSWIRGSKETNDLVTPFVAIVSKMPLAEFVVYTADNLLAENEDVNKHLSLESEITDFYLKFDADKVEAGWVPTWDDHKAEDWHVPDNYIKVAIDAVKLDIESQKSKCNSLQYELLGNVEPSNNEATNEATPESETDSETAIVIPISQNQGQD